MRSGRLLSRARARRTLGAGRRAVALAVALVLLAAIGRPAVAAGAALPGSYPLTAAQWSLCLSKVAPPQNGEASPCTDAMVQIAYHERKISAAEDHAWFASKAAGASGRQPTYSTPPDGTPVAYTTAGIPTAGVPAIGGGAAAGAPTAAAAPPTATTGSHSATSASINASGSPDYLTDLGLTSPFCGGPGLNATQQQNCRLTGSPWLTYPTANYGLDINTGSNGGGFLSVDVTGFVTGLLQELANGLWMFALYVLKAVITLVELAFGLNLFGNARALGGISGALANLYNNFDVPWFGAVLAAIGLWGIWTGLVQRKHSYTIGATLAAVLMVVVAMWIIAQPANTVGFVYGAANDAALELIAAPSQGTVTDPQRSFASAMSTLWAQMVRGPWCALDFTSMQFCNGKPEQAVVQKAAQDAYRDNGILLAELPAAMSPSGGDCSHAGAGATKCVQLYVERHQPYPPPATRAGLYLRYSPGSQPRTDLWSYYHGTDDSHILIFDVGGGHAGKNPEAVSIQGTDGWITRIGLLLLLGLGLLGALLMLVWIAVRLVLQTCMGLVLLVLTPIALVFPAFGEQGRAMFGKWGKSLLGALIGKTFYAAMLAAAVTGSSAITALAGASSSFGVSFLLLAAFWWALFLKRNEVLALVQAGPRNALADPERGHVAARAAAGYGAVLAARYGLRQVAEARSGRRQQNEMVSRAESQGLRQAAYEELAALEQGKATNEIGPAKRDLRERDGLRVDAKNTSAALAELEATAGARQDRRRLANQPAGELYTAKERQKRRNLIARRRGIEQHLDDHEARYARAEQIVGREARAQLGEGAISAGEVDRRIERLRNGDIDPASDQNLRAYAGMTAAQYARETPERQAAVREQIAAQVSREQALLAAVPPTERGGIQHAPVSAGEAAARSALSPGTVRERRQLVEGQLEERLRDRERERGLTRGVMRRRAGRRKRAAQLLHTERRQQAWAEIDARAAARANERLEAARRRGRGRP
jgi:hypothetical protein